jgi:hypothetical protein
MCFQDLDTISSNDHSFEEPSNINHTSLTPPSPFTGDYKCVNYLITPDMIAQTETSNGKSALIHSILGGNPLLQTTSDDPDNSMWELDTDLTFYNHITGIWCNFWKPRVVSTLSSPFPLPNSDGQEMHSLGGFSVNSFSTQSLSNSTNNPITFNWNTGTGIHPQPGIETQNNKRGLSFLGPVTGSSPLEAANIGNLGGGSCMYSVFIAVDTMADLAFLTQSVEP